MRLSRIAAVLNAVWTRDDPEGEDREPVGYSIDSRTIRPGDLFFAVKGENHDGHDFVTAALEAGAVAAIVANPYRASRVSEGISDSLIGVEDPLAALQALAAVVLESWRGRVVAVTGSMGKTTTKDMLASALSPAGKVLKSEGNLNNAFGLPLSVLRMESDGSHASNYDFAVLEMGMNHKGEIACLTRIAPPHVGVVTNVAPVHLEFFSSVEEIADAKAEMISGVRRGGLGVINADDPRTARMRELRSDVAFRDFGIDNQAMVRALDVRLDGVNGSRFTLVTPAGETPVHLPLTGRHNIHNALAAAAVADFYRVPLDRIAQALGQSVPTVRRGNLIRFDEGFTLVDDSYNSNPRALGQMAGVICASPGYSRRIVVAGEMLELGATAGELHRESGRQIVEMGVDRVIGVRGLAQEFVEGAREAGLGPDEAVFCRSNEEAAQLLGGILEPGDIVLVKGSRGVRTEEIVDSIKRRYMGGRAHGG